MIVASGVRRDLIRYAKHESCRLDIGNTCRRVRLGAVCHFNGIAVGGRTPRAPPSPPGCRQGDSDGDSDPDAGSDSDGDAYRVSH